ncbi:MAG: cytochrome C [Desulfuromonadaceae bacterium]|nr:cytochrome C [Desulfuromonadaceae bacterium]
MKRILLCSAVVMFVTAFTFSSLWAMSVEECLECHSDAELVGDANQINGPAFMATDHAGEGCVACHEVSDEHPDDGAEVGKAAVCADCHDGVEATYSASVHGANATCTDCHDVHRAQAPVSLSGIQMNQSCQGCHDYVEVETSHGRWLPEADIHVRSVPCVTCHSSTNQFVVTLYVMEREGGRAYADFKLTDYAKLKEEVGSDDVTLLLDVDRNGEISLSELNSFYDGTAKHGMRLWAMMTPETVDHDFSTMDNRWDCTYCHAAGPEAMSSSFVAFPQPDGTYKRLPMQAGATVDALFGTPDFYMVGATRSKILNYIGLLILLGGLAMPIGHGSLRFLTRKNRRKDH